MVKWKIKNTNNDIKNAISGNHHPVIFRLLQNRGITTPEEIESFFDSDYGKNMADPLDIFSMEKAVSRIIAAKKKKEKIAIFGDYDADGVTATAMLSNVLSDLGFKNVSHYIPDRQIEGYGLNEEAIKYISKTGVKLIITVDCGITNYAEVEKARKLGIDVIITDHHHVLPDLPQALAIINPCLPDSGFKCKDLAGVGVAFKLAQALYKTLEPDKIDQLKWTLDLVAIGTIADCVPLLGENRVLAKYGLIVLSKTRRVGLQELFKVGRITIDEDHVPDAHQVAFQIAPRINAAGRMDHASVSYNLIVEPKRVKARELALEVESKNQERQKITSEIVREVQVLAQNSFRDKNFIFAKSPNWPIGILGLVAGKITDEFRKPTIIIHESGNVLTGSLRSIPEVDIMKVLEQCTGLLIKFGGHSQAAGLKLEKEKTQKFYEQIEKIIDNVTDGREFIAEMEIDLEIKPEDIDWELIENLRKMEPFGQGNPEPVFLTKKMEIYELKVCGNGNKHLKLSLGAEVGPKIFDAIGFSMFEKFPDLKVGDKIDIVFNLCEDSWNGNKKIQIKLIDLKINEPH